MTLHAAYHAAAQAYQRQEHAALPLPTAQRMAFERVIAELRRVQTNVLAYRDYAKAIRFNQTLWALIQTEIREGKVALPEHIRAQLLSLAEFIDRHTVRALAQPDPDNLTPLIDINRHILSGLLHQPNDNNAPPPTAGYVPADTRNGFSPSFAPNIV